MAFAPSAEQKKVIEHRKGALAVVACPGSGKTETMSRRIAELIVSDEVDPSGIVAFTFTRKAAAEIRDRIRDVAAGRGADTQGMFIGTIDAFCLSRLKRLRPEYHGFGLLDSLGRFAFIYQRYWKLGIGRLDPIGGRRDAGGKIRAFCNSVDVMIREDVEGRFDIDRTDILNMAFKNSYRRYRWALRKERYLDFVTVVDKLISLLSPGGGASTRDLGVQHLVVDECQDVDGQQKRLIGILAEGADSACVVGDDDQAIFHWRGGRAGELGSLLAPKRPRLMKLQTNYRSTAEIVRNAAMLISCNHDREKKTMLAYRGQPNRFQRGDLIRATLADDEAECAFIRGHIDLMLGTEFDDGDGPRRLTYGDMAVLVRSNKDGARIAGYLKTRGIPVDLDGRSRAYMAPVPRIATRGIMHAMGRGDARGMGRLVRAYRKDLPGADSFLFRGAMRKIMDGGAGLGSQAFMKVVSAMGADLGQIPEDGMMGLAELSSIVREYDLHRGHPTSAPRYDLDKFVKTLADYGYSGPPPDTAPGDAVHVMTVWKAKGLEFPAVFIPSYEYAETENETYVDGSLYPSAGYSTAAEDNRRLLYVAITRSQKHLILTDTEKNPHRFMEEMDQGSFSGSFAGRKKARRGARPDPEKEILTYDGVASYDRCPQEFVFRHVARFVEALHPRFDYSSNALAVMSRIHDTRRAEGRVPTPTDVDAMAKETFRMRIASDSIRADLLDKTVRMIADYVERHAVEIMGGTDSDVPLVHDLEGASVSDSADLISGGGGVTGVTDFDVGSGKNHDVRSERARFRAAAVSKLKDTGTRSSVYYLDSKLRKPVSTGEAANRRTLAWMTEAIRGISKKEFAAAPEASKCRQCAFKDICEDREPKRRPASGTRAARRTRQTTL